MSEESNIVGECAALVAAFAYHIDHRNRDEVVALFTPDGRFDRPGVSVSGHESLGTFMDGRPENIATAHVCGPPHFISVNTDEAHAVTYFTLYQAERPESGFPAFAGPTAIAEYHDHFRRTDAGWRIEARSVAVKMVSQPA